MGVILPSTSGAMISGAAGMAVSLIAGLFTEIKSNNVSASGTIISILTRNIKTGEPDTPCSEPIIIEHFADDKSPFSISPTTYNHTSHSYNGRMISWKSVPVVTVEVSVIPNSIDDINLSNLVYWEKFEYGYPTTRSIELNIKIPRVKATDPKKKTGEYLSINFINGRVKDAPGGGNYYGSGAVATADGRLEGNTYVFEFTEWWGGSSPMKEKSMMSKLKDAILG